MTADGNTAGTVLTCSNDDCGCRLRIEAPSDRQIFRHLELANARARTRTHLAVDGAGIEALVGNGTDTTLAANAFTLTGANSGTASGLDYSGVANLAGTGPTSFTGTGAGSVSGTIS